MPITTLAMAVHSVPSQFSHQWVDKLFTGDGGDEVWWSFDADFCKTNAAFKVNPSPPKSFQMGLHRVANKVGKGSWFSNLNRLGLQEASVARLTPDKELNYCRTQLYPPRPSNTYSDQFYQEIDPTPSMTFFVWQRWLVDIPYRIRTIDPNMSFPMLSREFARILCDHRTL